MINIIISLYTIPYFYSHNLTSMKIEQIYTGCLAEAAYYITSNGEAAIVDPLRDIQPYLERLQRDNVSLKYIFETHFHADFVSGHVDLAQKTGATIVYGPTEMKTGFEIYVGKDGELFPLGKSKIKLIHTPGHTMESSCFLVINEDDKEEGIITGDTLFIGDVGRPDLAQHVIADLTQDKLARHLYHSLRNKIMPLSDDLIVYPNHGAGSACGKNMSKETTDTLGNQKKTNYALNLQLTEDQFVEALLDGLTTPPSYFPKNVLLNITGYESLDNILERGKNKLSVEELELLTDDSSILVLDTREASAFAKEHIPNSINIGLNGNFAQWVGELIPDIKQKIVLITDYNKIDEAITRLSRIGYDNTIGYLVDGFESWKKVKKTTNSVTRISAQELENKISHSKYSIYDVRKRSEYASQHLKEASNIPLNELEKRINEFPTDTTFILHCAGGYRSMIAASILKKHQIHNFIEIEDGFAGLKNTELQLTHYLCPTTML